MKFIAHIWYPVMDSHLAVLIHKTSKKKDLNLQQMI